jgi:uncharacterized protein (TIGR03067 family)
MRLTQLKSFAAIVAVALGLTAALAALPGALAGVSGTAPAPSTLLAAPAASSALPAPRDDKEDKAAKEAEAKELKLLQGKWRMVTQEVNGQEIPVEVIAGMRVSFEKDVMTVEGKQPRQLEIKIAPGKSPKQLDWTVLDGDDRGEMRRCIYKLEGDKLTLCIAEPGDGVSRPKEFKGGQGVALFTLERVKDEKEELAALAGEWKAVKEIVKGKETSADEIRTKWGVKGTDIAMSIGDKDNKVTIKVDPAAAPTTIDMTVTEGDLKGREVPGVYFRQGDRLTIALCDPKTKKLDRPTELQPGDDVVFIVLERVPKK